MIESQVQAYSAKREQQLIVSLFCIVLLAGGLTHWQNRENLAVELTNYQSLADTLNQEQQFLFRNLVFALPDITYLYEESGFWPEAFVLDEEAVPPFARNLLPSAYENLSWLAYQHGSWVDYWGASENTGYTFVLRIIDLHSGYHPHPHPGVDYDPKKTTALQVWFYPVTNRTYPGERLPEAGWKWLLASNDPLLKNK